MRTRTQPLLVSNRSRSAAIPAYGGASNISASSSTENPNWTWPAITFAHSTYGFILSLTEVGAEALSAASWNGFMSIWITPLALFNLCRSEGSGDGTGLFAVLASLTASNVRSV